MKRNKKIMAGILAFGLVATLFLIGIGELSIGDCNDKDGWKILSVSNCCNGDYATTCVSKEYRDYSQSIGCTQYVVTDTWEGVTQTGVYCEYGCSNGICNSAPQPTVPTTIPPPPVYDCSYKNGWVTVGTPTNVCDGDYATTQVGEEYRTYTPTASCEMYDVIQQRIFIAPGGAYCEYGCVDGFCNPTPTTTTTTSTTTTITIIIEEPPEPDNIVETITQWIQDIISYFTELVD